MSDRSINTAHTTMTMMSLIVRAPLCLYYQPINVITGAIEPDRYAKRTDTFEFDLSFVTIRKRTNCVVHQIELIVNGIFAKRISGHAMIQKVLKLLSDVKRKRSVNDYLRAHCHKTLLQIAPTRWGSLSAVLDRFVELLDSLFEVPNQFGCSVFYRPIADFDSRKTNR